jgi:hypothetical protein
MVRVGTSSNENEPPFGWGGAPRARATPTYGDQHTHSTYRQSPVYCLPILHFFTTVPARVGCYLSRETEPSLSLERLDDRTCA